MKNVYRCYRSNFKPPRLLGATLLFVALVGCNDHSRGSQRVSETTYKSKLNEPMHQRTSFVRPAIRINGNKFVNEQGELIQLRGVNLMGMEYIGILGNSPSDPFYTVVESTWPALHAWHVNAIRIPLNESSYLGHVCVDDFTGPAYGKPGVIKDPDPGHNYKIRLREVIDRATNEGFYIILDLHVNAPNDAENAVNNVTAQCAREQNPAPDADHAIEFWTDLAQAYKDHPNILFDIFDEPFIDEWRSFADNDTNDWKALRDGTTVQSYLPLWAMPLKHPWQSVGMQRIVNVIRNAGSTNIILVSGLTRSSNLSSWVKYKPVDPLNQLAAAWHAFPNKGSKWGDQCYSHPGSWCDDRGYSDAEKILAGNFPVIVTAFGDRNATGTIGAPFVSKLLPRLDSMGISYLGWTFTAASTSENQLIKDNFGAPTDGYGQYVKTHYLCRALGAVSCSQLGKDIADIPRIRAQSPSNSATGGWLPSSPPI